MCLFWRKSKNPYLLQQTFLSLTSALLEETSEGTTTMKAVLRKTPSYYHPQIPISWDQVFPGSTFSTADDGAASGFTLCLAHGSFSEPLLASFPGHSPATQHKLLQLLQASPSCLSMALRTAGNSAESSATRDPGLRQPALSRLLHLLPHGG